MKTLVLPVSRDVVVVTCLMEYDIAWKQNQPQPVFRAEEEEEEAEHS
jgi:hypothetical protein